MSPTFVAIQSKAWIADGMSVDSSTYGQTICRSSHLTGFGGGFHVEPTTIDFNFVFAKASFADNMTIYMTIIVTLALYLILMIWSKYNDIVDEKHLVSRPLVDNDPKDNYLYEILAFTGQWREASCNSKIEIIVTGEDDQTETRTLDPGWKDTLRKGCVDSYIMRTPRYGIFWFSWMEEYSILNNVESGERRVRPRRVGPGEIDPAI